MKKKIFTIIGICAACILLIAVIMSSSKWLNNGDKSSGDQTTITTVDFKTLPEIREMASRIDYNKYNIHKIIPAGSENGNFPENIKGDSKAPVIIYEYADYQCSSCAAMNEYLNQIVEDYKGKVAVVFRSYILSYHANGVSAASAANAAALQGYWPEYKDLLFANQNDWFYNEEKDMQKTLERYFMTASNNQGDLEKFRADMQSDEVAKKVAFDWGLADHLEIGGTPWLYLDGKWIDNEGLNMGDYLKKIRAEIDKKLSAK